MQADTEIRYLGDLQRITRQPGDIFVLTVDELLSDDQASRMGALIERALGAPCLVLGHGMRLGVVGTSA